MQTTTSSLGDLGGIDLVAFGARSGLLIHRPGFTLAGLGVATHIPLLRPHGGEAAQHALAALAGPNELPGVPGTGPVGFAALPFDRFAPGTLVVPEIVLGQNADGQVWLSITSDRPPSSSAALANIAAVARRRTVTPSSNAHWSLRAVLPSNVWRDEIVASVRDRIVAGELTKAVLAREAVFETDSPIDSATVVEEAARRYPTANVFSVDGFIGASPELLVMRERNVVRANPLAGTARRSEDADEDAALAAELHASRKNRSEHQITIDWFLNELLPFCSYVDAEPEPSIMSLANVHHLGTVVEGVLSSPPASILELVAATHPTPAVGGDPQALALEVIDATERADRGRYGGPTGWVDGAGNGAFAVGIRSAEIDGTTARVFAGVGVVAGSDPQAELEETRVKFLAMLGPLLAPWPDAHTAIATL